MSTNQTTAKPLREHLPREFFSEHTRSRAAKHVDVPVVREHRDFWPGREKNVLVWWELANGRAVGWNENPARGWSFPVVKMPVETEA